MTHTYHITGMTCAGCEAKVKHQLLLLEEITQAEVSKDNQTALLTMTTHVPLHRLQEAIGGKDSKYQISAEQHNETAEQAKSWLATYKPVLLIFTYLLIVSGIVSFHHGAFHLMQGMGIFMAGFFLVFSFFKLLNLKAFAESYAMYDIVAGRFPGWGYIYAFLELTLGIGYVVYPESLVLNVVAFVVMTVSIVGVLKSVLNKQQIQCACLGTVFNLPMSTLTIIEDALMIVMSAFMMLSAV